MIIIVDTSVFLNVLDVPGFNQHRDRVLFDLASYRRQPKANYLFLPLATIFETGNHITHLSDGRDRRRFAEKFAREVRAALREQAPWRLLAPPEARDIESWLNGFPDHAMRGASFGDLSIIREWHKQCELAPRQRVLIWSLDAHLAGHDRQP